MSIGNNFLSVQNRAAAAARNAGRAPEEVTVISVSKTFPYDAVQEAVDSGIRLFGENKVQEAREKIPMLKGDFVFHMIGHLQTNKAREAVALFDVIHSIDSLHIAEKVNAEAARIQKTQKILIQLNASGEDSKSGADFTEALKIAERCLGMNNISLLGFMTIGPLYGSEADIRRAFAKTREALEQANGRLGTAMKELSMGMSGDFEAAISEGATMIRVGSLIFGRRNYQ